MAAPSTYTWFMCRNKFRRITIRRRHDGLDEPLPELKRYPLEGGSAVVNGIEYTIVRGSDVDRDGMYLELSETESKKIIAEVFYSDRTHDFSLSFFQPDVPLSLIESLINEAKQLLPAIPALARSRK